MKKIIYWRYKGNREITKDFIQKDLGDMLELSDTEWEETYPTRVIKNEIDIIKIEEHKEE